MELRYSLDIGTNSIGWCIYEIDGNNNPFRMVDAGARVYSDGLEPKSETSKASARREQRSARRRNDRVNKRKKELMTCLVRHKLMPDNEEERKKLEFLDPYKLRYDGIKIQLPPFEVGRAIFHLNQRRGFKSNRKSDAKNSENGVVKDSINSFKSRIESAGCHTAGEYLYTLRKENKPVRGRRHGTAAKDLYDTYMDRAMAEFEFNEIWVRQKSFNPAVFSESAYHDIKDAVFFQRPLKPVKVGKCPFIRSEERAQRALPISERFRIYQMINDIRIINPDMTAVPLNESQRETAAALLFSQKEVKLDKLKLKLGLGGADKLNFEHTDKLKGDEIASVLGSEKLFGKRQWQGFDIRKRTEIVKDILDDKKTDEQLREYLKANFTLSDEQLNRIINAPLPDGRMRYCEEVLNRLTAHMEKGLNLYEAMEQENYETGIKADGSYDKLPYYGQILINQIGTGTEEPEDHEEIRYGKIANPTVHRGLRQLQRVVNRLIEKYGKPEQIVVELARDLKNSKDQKQKIIRQQAENKKINDNYAEQIKELGHNVTRENLDKMKLWNEANHTCPYSGQTISMTMLFSPEVEIEHILPFSRTLDNSMANKTVSMRRMNRVKGEQSPYEAFAHTAEWESILGRAYDLPDNKRWRFAEDAMSMYEKEGGFLGRQLNETRYLSKMAKLYLGSICSDTWVVTGSLTSMIRRYTGLIGLMANDGTKNRKDHRHHAVDAMAIGLIDRSMLQKISRIASGDGYYGHEKLDSLYMDYAPWKNFYHDAKAVYDNIVVSHKQEHRKTGGFFNETAYGIVDNDEGGNNLVTRKSLENINFTNYSDIRDKKIRNDVKDVVDDLLREGLPKKDAEKELRTRLNKFSETTGINKVRILVTNESIEKVKDKTGKVYKAYTTGEYHHVDVFKKPDGKLDYESASYYDVSNKKYMPRWKREKNNKLVLRLHKKDIVKVGDEKQLYIVLKIQPSPSNKNFMIAPISVGSKIKEIETDKTIRKFVSFSNITKQRIHKVFIDEIGEVKLLRY